MISSPVPINVWRLTRLATLSCTACSVCSPVGLPRAVYTTDLLARPAYTLLLGLAWARRIGRRHL
ncbi:hypothetical protein RSAG8_07444, partial [Rhizoctonia solani AG-8 WAC10335]